MEGVFSVMDPLIEIKTVPIEIQMKVTRAHLEYARGTAQVEISRDKGGLNIRSQPIQVNHQKGKLALAHNRVDVLETFLMSLIFEGRLHTFHPKTYLSRTGITAIRPLCYLPEYHVRHMVEELNLPVVKSPCPANGETKRQEMKELMQALRKRYPDAPDRFLHALQSDKQYDLWQKE